MADCNSHGASAVGAPAEARCISALAAALIAPSLDRVVRGTALAVANTLRASFTSLYAISVKTCNEFAIAVSKHKVSRFNLTLSVDAREYCESLTRA